MAEELPWHHLPEDPLAFFGLDPGFDRRQLKRRYGEYIRRYRPESNPNEFQRIRAAYEHLEHGLRYRDLTPASEPAAADEPLEESGPLDPADHYRKLRARSTRSARDYWHLVLLSDVVEPADGEGFDYWLVEGTGQHPAAFHRLLLERCRDPRRRPVSERVIEHIAARLPAAGFYATTEQVWLHRFRREPLEQVAAHLDRCESLLRDASVPARSIFVIRLLPIALWRDPGGRWCQEALSWIDEHGTELVAGLDEDILWADALLRYLGSRSEILNGSPVRAEMDRVIRLASVEGEVVAQRELMKLGLALGDRPEELRRAFPLCLGFDPADALWPTWSLLIYRLTGVTPDDSESPEASEAELAAARVMLGRIESRTNRSLLGVLWWLYGVGALLGLGALLTVLPAWPLAAAGVSGYGIVLIVCAWAGFGYFVIKPRWLDGWHARRVLAFARRAYRDIWRSEVFDFTARVLATPQRTTEIISRVRTEEHSNAELLTELMGADLGLAIHSLGVRATNE